ncbi:MAG: sirohydrochlorin chelatase [Coleofasciculaceae cyanobacterium]
MSSAYLLVSHGSRDPRPQRAMEKLAQLVRERLETRQLTRTVTENKYQARDTKASTLVINSSWYPLVDTAVLELASIPLHEQIQEFANLALATGCNQIKLLPVFLLPGVHVMEDIPAEVVLAQQSLGEAVKIQQLPHLGSHPDLKQVLINQFAQLEADAKILLSHGTRRTGGNETVEALADSLGAVAAYWSIPPTLEEQVKVFAIDCCRQISVLPYFFFQGGITDAIAQKVADLKSQFPTVQLRLAEPIGVTVELANLIVDWLEGK